mmetsp:Transcript_26947/g.52535  ORF Transcript_26947/g.52535 Transcript_26947/m.52535 type:complete len:212 (-) Transcript_26947:87-722(-)
MPVLLVVVEDLAHREHARILLGSKVLALLRLVIIQNAPHEGRNQPNLGVSTRHSLVEVEEEGHVACDALLLKRLPCLDAFPCRRNLDQDPILLDTVLLVESEDLVGLGDGGLDVKGEPSIHLSAHVPWHKLCDLDSKRHSQPLRRIRHPGVQGIALGCLDGIVHKLSKLGVVDGGEDQRRVRRCVDRLQLADAVEIAGVSDDLGVLAEGGT